MQVAEKISRLQQLMKEKGLTAYIVYSQDAHQSEYVADYFRARAFMSGFTGSAGTLVVTLEEAALWVDGRYFLQGEAQLQGSGITLMKMGEPGVPAYEEFLLEKTPAGGKVGVDGRTISSWQAKNLRKKLDKKQITLHGDEDLVGLIWDNRPSLPLAPIFDFPVEFAGETRAQKIERVRAHMREVGADYYLIASLESSAWLLNYRGSDIHATPVAYAFTLVSAQETVLFMEEVKVPADLREVLEKDKIRLLPYGEVENFLKELPAGKIALSEQLMSLRIMESLSPNVTVIPEEGTDAVIRMKAVKNPVELMNFKKAHVKDGAVMARFIRWVKSRAESGITECEAAKYLDALRCEQENSLGISFDTIAGYGPSGAIIHYKPEEETCLRVKKEGFLLVDSGAQYLEGTTDITRTIAMGPLTEEMKRVYTLVLKGHLSLGHAVFKEGITGSHLDILARKPLWEAGLDYKHGTGHGVGHVLSVHEGPQSISNAINQTKLEVGMIISNEPGFYLGGQFGVRIENLVAVERDQINEWGVFDRLQSITLCPYEREAICLEMLSKEEIEQIDAYHAEVYEKIAPLLEEEDRAFLAEACAKLGGEEA